MLEKLSHLRRIRKIRRYKPKFWLLPHDNLGYIQIPKVASTSIHNALTSHITEQDATSFEKQNLRDISDAYSEHVMQADIRKLHPKAFIFSFVRHPYERIYSCYKNKISSPDIKRNIFACHSINLEDSFDTFVDKICEIPDIDSDRHFRSQSWFLMANSLLIPDFIGKFENMNEDWNSLVQRFNLPELPHFNPTTKTKNELSSRNKSLIQQRYHEDFTHFYENQF